LFACRVAASSNKPLKTDLKSSPLFQAA